MSTRQKTLQALLVEDSPRDAALLLRRLSRAGYDLTSERVDTAEATKSALESREWDVILCDYAMPQFNALEAFDLVKALKRDIPFIIISGTIGEDVAVDAMRAGVHDYVMKGKLSRLVPAIERELEEAYNRRTRRAMFEISQAMSASSNLDELLKLIHRAIGNVVYAENCFVALHNDQDDTLDVEFFVDKYDAVPPLQTMGKGCAAYVFRTGEPLLIDQKLFDQLESEGKVELVGRQSPSWVGVPLKSPAKTLGVLGLQHYEDEGAYGQRDLEFLISVGGQIAVAIERKQAEQALRESERRLQLAIESSNTGLWDWDLRTNAVWYSREWKHQIGYEDHEISNEFAEWQSRLHPDDLDAAIATVAAYLKDPRPNYENEFRFRHKDGSYRWILARASLVPDKQGNSERMIGSHVDITERKRSEEALRQSEERYRDLVENAQDIIYSHDLQGNYTSCNAAVEIVTGYTVAEALKLNFSQTIAPEYLERTREMLARKLAGGETETTAYELELIAKDGHRVPMEVNTRVVSENGVPLSVHGIARDISDRKRAEEALRVSEKRYRAIVDSNVIGVYVASPTGMIKDANDRLLEMVGYTRAEFEAGAVGWQTLTASGWENADEYIGQQVATRGFCPAVEKEFLHKDGRRVAVNVTVAIMEGDGGDAVTLVEDITERKQHEKEVLRLATAVEQTADSIVITDTNGNIQYVNPAFERITGYAKEEALGKTPSILKSGKTDLGTYEELWQTITKGKVWSGQLLNKKKDGTLFEERVTISPVRDASGDIVNYIAVKQDITQQLQLEQQLRQSQRLEAIGQLAGGVAHDFNNLLTAILGYSDLTLAKLEAGNPLINNLREIKKAGERAAGLTRQLLAFSRKQMLAPRVLDLNSIVSDLNKMLRRLIGEDIELVTKFGVNLGSIKADPTQVEQVIMNLVVNSRDAMPNGGTLTIETRNVTFDEEYVLTHQPVQTGDYVALVVSDTGSGMDAETQARIFEPFFTTKEVGKGTGLGLSTIYGIVKQSGGYVWVYSEVGMGTTFKVYLPRVFEEAAVEAPAAKEIIPAGGTGTILVVEDNVEVRHLILETLKEAGYSVIECGDGSEALAVVKECGNQLHLLITDVVMPSMGGRELAEHTKKIAPDARVLFISGYTDDAVVRAGIGGQEMAFLEKPFTPVELVRKIADVMNA